MGYAGRVSALLGGGLVVTKPGGYPRALTNAGAFPITHSIDVGSRLMNVESLSRDLYGFAIELRQLAYTMPGGHEDRLIRLSERMIHHAQEEGH